MDDDYNFEDFDYEPEEIEKVENKTVTKENQVKNQYLPENKMESAKQTGEDYGDFIESVRELEDVKDEILSSKPPSVQISETNNNKMTIDSAKLKNENFEKKEIKEIKEKIEMKHKNITSSEKNQVDTNININKPKKNYSIHNFNNEFHPSRANEDSHSLSAILPQDNNFHSSNSRLHSNMNPYGEKSLNEIKGNNANVLSRKQIAEKNYYGLKKEIENITMETISMDEVSKENKTDYVSKISKKNSDLIRYLDKMNAIINSLIDSSRVPVRNPNFSRKIHHKAPSTVTQNSKLLDVYKKEFSKLEERLKQISDPKYEENLDETLLDLNNQINYFEQDNKKLKLSQKQSEVLIDRHFKNNVVVNNDLKQNNQDYENMKRLNEIVLEKVQKNKVQISENDNRINELNEWHKKLESIAKDMYGIKEYENVKEEEKSEKKNQEKRQILKKKLEVVEKVIHSNKKKYESEISRNEKFIFNLEKSKVELMKMLKEKTMLTYKSQEEVKGVYNHYTGSEVPTDSHNILGENFKEKEIVILNKIISDISQPISYKEQNMENVVDIILEKDESKSGKKEENKEIQNKLEIKEIQNKHVIGTSSNLQEEEHKIISQDNNFKNKNFVSIDPASNKRFKPNFKFNNDVKPVENPDSTKIANNQLNINSNKISEVISEVIEEHIKPHEDKISLNPPKQVKLVLENEPKAKEIDISNINDEETLLNVSRRKNNLNASRNKETEKSLIAKTHDLIKEEPPSVVKSIVKKDLPLFLQDVPKQEDNLNGSSLDKNNFKDELLNNRRRKTNQLITNNDLQKDSKVTSSIFEDAFKKENDSSINGRNFDHRDPKEIKDDSNYVIKQNEKEKKIPNFLEELNEISNTHGNMQENVTYDLKKKLEFDNLFKEDVTEIKSDDISGKNLMFGAKKSVNGRVREPQLNSLNSGSAFENAFNDRNSEKNIPKESKKPRNLIDELEEIVI
jgi:hypothetical protein